MPVIPIHESGQGFSHLDANVPFAIESAVVDGSGNLDVLVGNGRIRWGSDMYELSAPGGTTTVSESNALPDTTYYLYINYNDGAPGLALISGGAPGSVQVGADSTVLGSVTTDGTPSVSDITDLRGFLPPDAPRVDDGTAGTPAYGFTAESGLGLYRHGAGQVGVSGALRVTNGVTLDAGNIAMTNGDPGPTIGAGGQYIQFRRVGTTDSVVIASNDNILFESDAGAEWASLDAGGLNVNTAVIGLLDLGGGVLYDTNSVDFGDTLVIEGGSREYWANATGFMPSADGDLIAELGESGYAWDNVYADSFVNVSDARLKDDVQDSDLGLDFIKALKPRAYRKVNGRSGRLHYGLVAQEVKQAMDDLGVEWGGHVDPTVNPKFTDEAGNPISDRQAIRYSELHAPLIRAVQEIADRIEALENA